ncbi:MAG: ATP-dependent DNA helicase RecG, partial [Candidatus Competibacterales bacterium]|nr:ATP-dependent DNA helicase RecG [Candidatus Competibacterales bacterium]
MSASPETDTLQQLAGVGPKLAERLARLGILTPTDLLLHLPLRYQDRTRVTPIGALRSGLDAVVEGEIVLADVVRRRRAMLLCRLADHSGALLLRFFHFSAAQRAALVPGTRLRCFGEVRSGAGSLEMIHPEYRLSDDNPQAAVETHLTPIYPATEGLRQTGLRRLIERQLERLETQPLADPLPPDLRQRLSLPELNEALRLIHRPPPETASALAGGRHPVQRRLAFEELLAHQLSLRELRWRVRREPAPPLDGDGCLREQFMARLPFTLTAAQQRVADEIGADLAQPWPMLRLVQGDVGSGKTVVATLAALRALESGCQAALMAPTELLAEQHYRTLSAWLAPLDCAPVWLSSRIKGPARRRALDALADGSARLAVGTHALFQDEVSFHNLALVVIDEQHRFGVHQRLALREKGRQGKSRPHQLIMTATPIPRTLAMSVYADLDTSVIDELPPGRQPVTTVVIGAHRREQVVERIRAACREGRQAYWVCPLIEESEVLECQAAEDTAAQLTASLPELRVGLVHGRLRPVAKEAVMAGFQAGELDLLVATTVIEVGVDVPQASLMVIETAERMGLAQLHQLRGRVGRGHEASHCVLLYRPPLSDKARARLEVLRTS